MKYYIETAGARLRVSEDHFDGVVIYARSNPNVSWVVKHEIYDEKVIIIFDQE